MKKPLFLLLAVLSCGSLCQAQFQLLNPGFESWEGTSATAKPSNWSSFPQADGTWASFASTPQHYHRYGGRPGTSGSSFITIWTRSVLGTKANGNITTGQIHAGSTSASSSDNYNYTHRGTAYCHTFSGTPDSMYVWVSYYAASGSSAASIKAIIHGDNNFRSANDESNTSMYRGMATTTFTRTTSSSTTRQWQQKKVPFVYNGTSSVNYILMCVTTNGTPGGGSANDSLSVDDFEFIYSAWLNNISIDNTPIASFQRSTLNYNVALASLEQLSNVTLQYTPQASDATVSIDTLWLNDTTRQFQLHVLAEDTVTTHTYTVTLTAPMPVCDTVSNVEAQVFVNNVTIAWTAGTNNTAFEMEYGIGDSPQAEATPVSTTQTIATLSNLDYGTTYWCHVRGICRDTVYTEWSNPVVFTTDTLPVIECTAVDSLLLDTLGLSFASFHWEHPAVDSSDTAILFRVTLMQGNEVLSSYDSPDTLFSVDTLLPGLAYILSVSTVCDSERTSIPCIRAFTTLPDTVGIAPLSMDNAQVSIYPNPATERLTVESANPITVLSVVNTLGQVVYRLENHNVLSLSIDISRWHSGVFLLTVETPAGTATQKIRKL